MTSIDREIPTPDAMRALGAALGHALCGERLATLIITLQGELGAGKTTLVGGVINALGIAGTAKSPTYTLIEPYELEALTLYHMDLYRLADPGEVEALGLRDLLNSDAVLLIEWPERGAGQLPPSDLHLQLAYAPDDADGRIATLTAHSAAGQIVLDALVDTIIDAVPR